MPGIGTKADPWELTTPPGSSLFTIYRDDEVDPAQLVCEVGDTRLTYDARAIDDTVAYLVERGEWVPLGATDEGKAPAPGSLEEWARSQGNPIGGWYGLRRGYRGRFAMYIPPLLEELGLVDLEHQARNNRVRAVVPPA